MMGWLTGEGMHVRFDHEGVTRDGLLFVSWALPDLHSSLVARPTVINKSFVFKLFLNLFKTPITRFWEPELYCRYL